MFNNVFKNKIRIFFFFGFIHALAIYMEYLQSLQYQVKFWLKNQGENNDFESPFSVLKSIYYL